MWELCWIVEQLSSYSQCSECIKFVAMRSYGAHAMVFPLWVACEQTKGFMSLMESIVWPIQLDILTCFAVVSHKESLWVFVLCVGALLSLISLGLVPHVIALPKVIQGPCLVNRDDAYMGTCHKYHVMDALFVTFAIIANYHLVTHSICWIF